MTQVTSPTSAEIWTHRNVEAGWVNPIPIIVKNGFFGENTFIVDAWSSKTLGVTKRNWDQIGASKGNWWQKGLNGIACVAKTYLLNVSGCNFVKGSIGLVYSTGKAALHAVSFSTLLAIGLLVIFVGRTEPLIEAVRHLKFLIIDMLSIAACAGHMVPFWVPIVLTWLLPHLLLPLILVKIITTAFEYTGVADVVAYGPTLALHADLAYRANHPEADDGITDITEQHRIKREARELLDELNPVKSPGGAFACALMCHFVTATVKTLLDTFVPGVGTAAKLAIEYGPSAALLIGGTAVSALRKKEAPLQEPLLSA